METCSEAQLPANPFFIVNCSTANFSPEIRQYNLRWEWKFYETKSHSPLNPAYIYKHETCTNIQWNKPLKYTIFVSLVLSPWSTGAAHPISPPETKREGVNLSPLTVQPKPCFIGLWGCGSNFQVSVRSRKRSTRSCQNLEVTATAASLAAAAKVVHL